MTLSSENSSSSKPILPWCSREVQEGLMMDPQALLWCPDSASLSFSHLPVLISCVDAQTLPWGEVLPLPGGRNPGSIPRFTVPMQACLPKAQLDSRPPVIKYACSDFAEKMTRMYLYEGQRSFLKKSPAPTVEADEVTSLADCRLPMRPMLNQILSALAATGIRRLHVILQKYVYMASKRQVPVWIASNVITS